MNGACYFKFGGVYFATWRFFFFFFPPADREANESRLLFEAGCCLGFAFSALSRCVALCWVFTDVGPESITPFNIYYPQKYVVFSPLQGTVCGCSFLSRALLLNVKAFISCEGRKGMWLKCKSFMKNWTAISSFHQEVWMSEKAPLGQKDLFLYTLPVFPSWFSFYFPC